MPHEVIMPALGMAQDSGLIVAWHKSPGDAVAEGDALFEVETDKATMDVEAQAAGFLTRIHRNAGEDVPVGEVIALIGESADAAEPDPAPAPAATGLPEGAQVIMPALGMAQDSGLIVAWHKAPGDPVASGDILFEVETDKSTMEVESGHDGFVAALLARAGEEAPVGDLIAIISAEKPEAPLQRSIGEQTAAPPSAPPEPPLAAPVSPPPRVKPAAVASGGRILASPKARRLALEQGLDLNRLAAAGHPQPYHARDIEVLKSLPDQAAPVQAAGARRLSAAIPTDAFADFAIWAADHAGLADQGALLAGLAAASLNRGPATVTVEKLGTTRAYAVPGAALGEIAEADPASRADLCLRDLRFSRISSVELGAEECPVLTLLSSGDGLSLTLECAHHHLSAAEAVALLSEFAGRMEQPLRHLL